MGHFSSPTERSSCQRERDIPCKLEMVCWQHLWEWCRKESSWNCQQKSWLAREHTEIVSRVLSEGLLHSLNQNDDLTCWDPPRHSPVIILMGLADCRNAWWPEMAPCWESLWMPGSGHRIITFSKPLSFFLLLHSVPLALFFPWLHGCILGPHMH